MQSLRVLGFAFVTYSLVAGCAKGRDVKSASKEDKLAYDETGHGRKCDTPSSSCDEVKDQSLDFQEKCREGGFRMKQCGCENLCSGNINADRTGYDSKNQLKTCKDSTEACQDQETSAAYQDACDAVGGEMIECGCEWLCSKQLKNAIADAPKDDAADAGADDQKDQAKDDKPHGNMDGKSPEEAAKDKSSSGSSSSGKKKKSGHFSDPE
jgi:hypothetical protein